MDVAFSRHLRKLRKIFKKFFFFPSAFGLWFCQKSCTDKALCFFSYLTEILTKRVLFRHFCKSIKSPVFTGLFGLFTSYKCLILLTFWGNIFRYLRICFLICRNPSNARNQFAIKAREFESHRLRQTLVSKGFTRVFIFQNSNLH